MIPNDRFIKIRVVGNATQFWLGTHLDGLEAAVVFSIPHTDIASDVVWGDLPACLFEIVDMLIEADRRIGIGHDLKNG